MLKLLRRTYARSVGKPNHGCLDACSYASVSGWAINRESPESFAEVGVFVNGELKYRVLSDVYREDVKARQNHPTGLCGFKIDFPAGEFLRINDRVEVRVLPGNHQLLNSPSTINTYRQAHDRKFFFLHIPKTAGTAFRRAIVENFFPEATFPSTADIAANNGQYPNLFKETRKGVYGDFELFLGHYPFAIKHLLADDVQVILFLRDPVERAVSNLLHVKKFWPNLQDKSLQELLNIPQVLSNQIYNLQTQFLSDTTWASQLKYYHAAVPDCVALADALVNLGKVSFIGLTEEYELSLRMLEIKFGLRLIPVQTNVTESTQKLTVSPEIIQRVTENNQHDILLYERGKELFQKQNASLGLVT